MTKARVRKVRAGLWSLGWKTESMSAPAFWYYATRREAREAARKLRKGA
jgi:hypothetical protein